MSDAADGFGARLNLAMKLLNISPGALASAARADKSLVSRWLRGIATPRGPYLAVLTEIVHARVPGFTQLSWDLPADDFVRLVGGEGVVLAPAVATEPPAVEASTTPLPRRAILAAGAVAGAAALGVAGFLVLRGGRAVRDQVPAEVAPLMAQAQTALGQMNVEGNSQAVGLYRKVVAIKPDFADGWGALAYAYAVSAHSRSSDDTAELGARARDAAAHASALDPGNAYAAVALATLQPRIGHWQAVEQALRAALSRHPDHEEFLVALGILMMQVGRVREAAAAFDRAAGRHAPTPRLAFLRALTLWSANRLNDADQAITEAAALYPTHVGVWFTRYNMLLFAGRAAEALSMAGDKSRRPSGIPEEEFAISIAAARALADRKPADIDAAMAQYRATAPHGAGRAQNAIMFASAAGRLDKAFAIAEALFLGRGFDVAEVRFTAMQGSYTRRADRQTYFLFEPPTAAMRADPRFKVLAAEIGLERYWNRPGHAPDYRA